MFGTANVIKYFVIEHINVLKFTIIFSYRTFICHKKVHDYDGF